MASSGNERLRDEVGQYRRPLRSEYDVPVVGVLGKEFVRMLRAKESRRVARLRRKGVIAT